MDVSTFSVRHVSDMIILNGETYEKPKQRTIDVGPKKVKGMYVI